MLKKLLTLSLVAVILSVTAFAAPEAISPISRALANTTDVTETLSLTTTVDLKGMEILHVMVDEDGSKPVNAYSQDRTYDLNDNRFFLLKINIGEGWDLANVSEMTLTKNVRLAAEKKVDMYAVPLTKDEYIAAETNETTTLDMPKNVATTAADTAENTDTGAKSFDVTAGLTVADYVASYADGYLYMAVQFDGTGSGGISSSYSKWTFSVKGPREATSRTVDVTSGAFVDGATAGQQTIDVVDWTEDKTVTKNMWMAYKFDIPSDMKDVVKVVFKVNADGNNSYANICLLPLTEAEYAATIAGDDRTIATADRQTLLTMPYKASRGYVIPNPAVGSSPVDVSVDITSIAAEQAKTGSVCLVAFSTNKVAINADNTRTVKLKKPTLTISSTAGDSTIAKVNDFSDTVLMWDSKDNYYDVCTQTESGKAYLIAATFEDTTMVDAEWIEINAADKVNGAISGSVPALDEGTSLKIYLWKEGTLIPITNVIEF